MQRFVREIITFAVPILISLTVAAILYLTLDPVLDWMVDNW